LKYAKIDYAWVLKRCQTIKQSTTPASASKFEKMTKKHDIFQLSQDFFKTAAKLSMFLAFLNLFLL
jgi:hypothetical protein